MYFCRLHESLYQWHTYTFPFIFSSQLDYQSLFTSAVHPFVFHFIRLFVAAQCSPQEILHRMNPSRPYPAAVIISKDQSASALSLDKIINFPFEERTREIRGNPLGGYRETDPRVFRLRDVLSSVAESSCQRQSSLDRRRIPVISTAGTGVVGSVELWN